MTVEHPPRQAEDFASRPTRVSAAEALRAQQSFSREQVAWLMSNAMRWGYELRDAEDRGFWAGYHARVAEENSSWPDDRVLFRHTDVVRGVAQRTYRAECDKAARLPRAGDHRGGPAPMWGKDAEWAAA